MTEDFTKIGQEFQKAGKDGFETAVRSYGDANKAFQAIVARWTDYSKRTVEDAARAVEQLLGAKSLEQAIEIQSLYAKRAYDAHVAEMTKLGEMYAGMARDAYKPFEQALSKRLV
jgi:phasin family protein